MFIPIQDYTKLPNAPFFAMFVAKTEEQINRECKKYLNRIPDKIYIHRTGSLVPITKEEFDANAVSLAVYIPEERP
jgi:hypothetical protein